jgi:hypothetical protein
MILVDYGKGQSNIQSLTHSVIEIQIMGNDISQLANQFQSESEKNQLQLIPQLVVAGDEGLNILKEFLQARQSEVANLVTGKVYQTLYQANTLNLQEFLQNYFPTGIVPLKSEREIDYLPVQQALVKQNWQVADVLTREKLCELAGEAASNRKWLYFTEVEQFPSLDLHTLNCLWWIHSEGKFGFSVQRRIWLGVSKDYNKLWPKIGWKDGNQWTQYPQGFTWNISAPQGHLPLLNQLRGVRVADSLYNHRVWSEYNW